MTPEDRQAFLETVIGFAELKGKQLSAPALELYWRSLQHWELADFLAAAEQLLRTCEFMPTPKDFEDLRKAGRQTAGEAWAEVLDYVRRGYARWDDGSTTRFGNAKIAANSLRDRAVAAIGGYDAVAMSPTKKTPFLEHRFCEHYEAMREADEVRESVPQIACPDRDRISGPQSAMKILGKIDD